MMLDSKRKTVRSAAVPMFMQTLMLCAAIGAAPPVFPAGIIKCTDADGAVTYQDAPCAGTSRTQTIVPEPTPTPEAGPPPGKIRIRTVGSTASGPPVHGVADTPTPVEPKRQAPRPPASMAWLDAPERKEAEKIGQFAGGLAQCVKALPVFAAAHGKTVWAWTARNAATIRRAEADPYFGDEIRRGLEYAPVFRTDSERGSFELQCDALAAETLGQRTPTAGFETPQATVASMTNAMLTGRIDDALRSISPDSRERLRKLFAAQRPERLQRLLRAMSSLDSVAIIGETAENGQIASARYRLDGRGGEIHFIRYFDRWYITEVM